MEPLSPVGTEPVAYRCAHDWLATRLSTVTRSDLEQFVTAYLGTLSCAEIPQAQNDLTDALRSWMEADGVTLDSLRSDHTS